MISGNLLRSCRCVRPSLFQNSVPLRFTASRSVSTLPNNPHIYVFENEHSTGAHVLSLLPTKPPNTQLAIGTSTSLPPTPDTFKENPQFLGILQSVFHAYAAQDPDVKQQAAAFSSPGGFNLGAPGGGGAGPASKQGGTGGANRGGWLHVSDTRNPPDWGRIAFPEDIFGSLEVDGNGKFVDNDGHYQASGTYRIVTREGILGLPPFLRARLVERLKDLEKQSQQ